MTSFKASHLVVVSTLYYRQKKSPGHAGCSSGYNSALYQDVLDPSTSNTSGREQTNSLLDKIATSLKSMNYVGYMTTLRVFFGLRNLKNKNVLWMSLENMCHIFLYVYLMKIKQWWWLETKSFYIFLNVFYFIFISFYMYRLDFKL